MSDWDTINDDASPASSKPVELLDTEAQLHEAMEEWDRHKPPEPEPEPVDTSEFEERIAALEGEKSEWQSAKEKLESELAEATERGELIDDVMGFYEEAHEAIDRHDADRLFDHITRECGCDRRVAELEVKMRLLEDPRFAEAADLRFEDPERFSAMVSEFTDELMERYPRHEADHGLTAAIRAARDATVSRDRGDFGSVDWGRLSGHEFAQKRDEVFSAMKSGRLRSPDRRPGGIFTTSPTD